MPVVVRYCPASTDCDCFAPIPLMRAPVPTLLFCTSFCPNEAAWRARQRRWLDHHLAVPLAHDAVFVLDDASPFIPTDDDVMVLETLPGTPPNTTGSVRLPVRRTGRSRGHHRSSRMVAKLSLFADDRSPLRIRAHRTHRIGCLSAIASYRRTYQRDRPWLDRVLVPALQLSRARVAGDRR